MMNAYRKTGRITAMMLAIALVLVFSSCKGNTVKIEFSSPLTEEERVYYTGQDFDTMVSTERGMFSKIPNIYVVYADGSRSEDLSHSDNVSFSGYNPESAGEQTITVTYREGKNRIRASYGITVRQRTLSYMEADDTYHYLNPFEVGDAFVVSELSEDGTKRGVTISFRYNDPDHPREAYFADDPALDGIVFDTTGCCLDAEGKFTEPGTFTVQAVYNGLTATYKIRVTAHEEKAGDTE